MTSTPPPGSHPHTDLLAREDIDQLVALLGTWPKYRDERLGLALHRQVRLLIDLATAERPNFRRSVPVAPTDHDILISEVLCKLIAALDKAVADRDRLAARLETLEGAARLAERALRDQPMQAFRTAEAQRRRAAAIDALRALVAPDTPTSPTERVSWTSAVAQQLSVPTPGGPVEVNGCRVRDGAVTLTRAGRDVVEVDSDGTVEVLTDPHHDGVCTEPRPTSPTDTGDPT